MQSKEKSLKRKPGRGAPAGQTKADILIFLGHEKRTRQEIIDYAKSNLHIREKRGIDRHLSELLNDQLIYRIEEKKGFDVSFELVHSYEGFRSLFVLFLENRRLNEFLATTYSQSCINEEFLDELTSDVLYRLSYSFLRLATMDEEERASDAAYRSLIEISDQEDLPSIKPIVGYLEKSKSEDVLRDQPPNMPSNELKRWTEQKIDEVVRSEIDLLHKLDEAGESTVSQYRHILFPLDEIDEILAILKCSPSAMALLMSIRDKENIITGALTTNLFILVQDLLRGHTDLDCLNDEEYTRQLKGFADDPKFKQLRPTPLLQLARAMAIADIFAGNTLNGEWADGFLKKYLEIGRHCPNNKDDLCS